MNPGTAEAKLRQGPRPLPLHLAAAILIWLSSNAALPLARSGSLAWRRELAGEAQSLSRELAAAAPDRLSAALAVEAAERLAAMIAGIQAYRAHPYRRALPEPPVLWREGGSLLYDYGEGRAGPPVLFVPSLVNRGYILDLSERRSLVRFLAQEGVRPLLLEWGAPTRAERGFSFDDYVAGRLARALDAAARAAGQRVILAGYCMGGLMALAAALSRRDVAGLLLLATPWDFHAERAAEARRLGLSAATFEPLFGASVPVDFLQTLFAALDPALVPGKFRAFAKLDPESPEALDFVALEDWVNDGIPLALAVAHEVFAGWYGENRPARGLWRVAGRTVDPAKLAVPTLAVLPERDRIVPPKGALALAQAIPGAERVSVPFGHIGMVASAKAPAAVWPLIARWLRDAAKERSRVAMKWPKTKDKKGPGPGRAGAQRRSTAPPAGGRKKARG